MGFKWSWVNMTQDQEEFIGYLYASLSAISIIGSILIIATFLIFKHLRTFANFLVCFLTLSDIMASISNIMSFGLQRTFYGCQVQAYLMQFFDTASFYWTTCIAIHAYLAICWVIPNNKLKRLFPVYLLICYGVPLVSVIVIAVTDSVGHVSDSSYSWCWIGADWELLRFILYYIPLAFMWLGCGILYLFIMRSLFQVSFTQRNVTNIKLLLYISVFILCSFFGLLNRIVNIFYPHPIFWLYLLQSISSATRGLWNAIVYGLTKHRVEVCMKYVSKVLCFPVSTSIYGKSGPDDPSIQYQSFVPPTSGSSRAPYAKYLSIVRVSDDEVADLWDDEVDAITPQNIWEIQAKDAFLLDSE